MKKPLLTLAACVIACTAFAQGTPHVCSADEVYWQMVQNDPSILHHRAALEAEIQEYLKHADLRDDQPEITIPLVFHILHLKGFENITNEQILDQVALLNRDFAKLNPDTSDIIPTFQDRIGRSKIRFALATKDEYGNCTNGIDRIQTVQTLYGESFSKYNQWPRNRYLNIWVARNLLNSGAAAYALYPGATEGFMQLFDGIMSRHNYVGSIGTSGSGNAGRTITHEMGHSLNLSHVWGDTNLPGVNCGDDGVQDTPLTLGHTNCPVTAYAENARCDRFAFDPLVTTYHFDQVTTSSGTTDPAAPVQVVDTITGAVRTTLSQATATGVSANSGQAGKFAFSGWGLGAEDGNTSYAELTEPWDPTRYYEITISPEITDVVKVDTLSLVVGRSHNGPRTFVVRTSVNNFTSSLPILSMNNSIVAAQGQAVGYFVNDTEDQVSIRVVTAGVNSLTPVTYRIYAWHAEAAAGQFIVDDLYVKGVCGAIENFQNYMDYSNCNKMFTHGQIDRMYAALHSPVGQRDQLWTEANLAATGVAPGTEAHCPPSADFYAVVGTNLTNPSVPFSASACTNVDVRFVDNSSSSFVTDWSWEFQDGSPATSTERNPIVAFTSPGWKSVTLTVSNEHGSTTKTLAHAVHIGGGEENLLPPLFKSFESNTLHPFRGENHDLNHTSWNVVTGYGSHGNRSARLNSGDRDWSNVINGDNYGDIDDLLSPIMNLSSLSGTGAALSFDYHYTTFAADTGSLTEDLEIRWSANCGRTWNAFSPNQMSVTDLVTNGNAGTPGNWRSRTINLPNGALTDNVMFRFRYTSSPFSGDLHIDNIYIGAPVGIDEVTADKPVNIFPNPTEGNFTLQVLGLDQYATSVMIQDLSGATVYSNVFAPQGGVGLQVDARALGLANGMYMIHARNEAGAGTTKLMVGR